MVFSAKGFSFLTEFTGSLGSSFFFPFPEEREKDNPPIGGGVLPLTRRGGIGLILFNTLPVFAFDFNATGTEVDEEAYFLFQAVQVVNQLNFMCFG